MYSPARAEVSGDSTMRNTQILTFISPKLLLGLLLFVCLVVAVLLTASA